MSDNIDKSPLQIKKYPNRRFYDASRSRHVTLPELHDLICQGHEIVVQDAKSGDDITNLILTQIILERDASKLSIFPSNILHQVIRTQQQFLGGVVEQYFRQTLDAYRASQERWAEFLQNTLGATPGFSAAVVSGAAPASNPFDWSRQWLEAFRPQAAVPPAAPPPREAPELDELRRQLAELTRRLEKLSPE